MVALTELGTDSPGYVYVVDTHLTPLDAHHDNQLVAHPNRQRGLTGDDPIDMDLTARIEGRSASELATLGDETYLISSAHNPNLDWVVVAVEPAEYALAPVAGQNANLLGNLLTVTLILARLVLAGTLVAGFVGTRLMVALFRRLATSTEAVAAG